MPTRRRTVHRVSVLSVSIAAIANMAVAQQPTDLPNIDDPEVPILTSEGPSRPTELGGEAYCSDSAVRMTRLSWTPAEEKGLEQRVDTTAFRRGFERGEYRTFGPLDPDVSDYLVEDILQGGSNIYWRVLTLTAQGWVPSETDRCDVAICPRDGR